MENAEPNNTTTYFALDGNYGDADGIVIVDTSTWSEEDWQAIDEAGDSDRASVALALAKSDDLERESIRDAVLENDLDRQFDKAIEKE
jgi:hypothetical protein